MYFPPKEDHPGRRRIGLLHQMEDGALASSVSSASISSICASPTRCNLMNQFLPKVIPSRTTLIITKRSILQLAIVKLGVKLHQIQVTPMNDNDLLGFVCMDIPPHRKYPYTSRQEFFGKYTPWKEEAIESACSAALDYLKIVGFLIIDEANYVHLKICQEEQQKTKFWEDAFRNRATTLQAALAKSVPATHHIVISDDSGSDDQVNIIQTDPVIQDPSHKLNGRKECINEHMSGTSAVHTTLASTGLDDTDSEMTPNSISKLPSYRNKDVSSTSTARKALFQEPDHLENEPLIHAGEGGGLPKKARN